MPPQLTRTRREPPQEARLPRLRARPPPRACRRRPAAAECAAAPSLSLTRAGSVGSSSAARAAVPGAVPMLDPVSLTRTRCPRAAAGPRASRARRRPTLRPPSGPPPLTSSGYETDTPDEVQQEAVRRVCGALGMREQFEAAMAAGELLEMLESLPRGAVEASVRQMRGYIRTGEWPEPILTSPTPQRGRSPSPVDEWSDG